MLRILGFGNVGKRVGELAETSGVRVWAVADSTGVLTDPHAAVRTPRADGALDESRSAVRRAAALKKAGKKLGPLGGTPDFSPLVDTRLGRGVVADCSASERTDILVHALSAGHGVVLANKKPLTGSSQVFLDITSHPHARWEATVGAGLPVIVTARRMLESGDVIKKVQGQLSGTLGFLLSSLDDPKNGTFSEVVKKAEEMGYTEPDPRDDLGGTDVARKALILARYALGMWQADMDDVKVEPLFPREFAALSITDFRRRLPELDNEWRKRVESARARGNVVRYAATCSRDGLKVGLVEAPLGSPLAGLRGTTNLISFQSNFYSEGRETIVSGPGAGVDVTASAVLADAVELLRSSSLGHGVKWAPDSA